MGQEINGSLFVGFYRLLREKGDEGRDGGREGGGSE